MYGFAAFSPFWLEPLDKAVHTNVDSIRPATTSGGSFAKLHPSWSGKVGALSTVKTSVEPRVIATGKCDHNLALVLNNLVVGNTVLSQDHWTYQAHLVSQVRWTGFLHLGKEAVCQPLKPANMSCGDGVPELGGSKVKIVDTVKVHVFRVPGKCGLPAAKV